MDSSLTCQACALLTSPWRAPDPPRPALCLCPFAAPEPLPFVPPRTLLDALPGGGEHVIIWSESGIKLCFGGNYISVSSSLLPEHHKTKQKQNACRVQDNYTKHEVLSASERALRHELHLYADCTSWFSWMMTLSSEFTSFELLLANSFASTCLLNCGHSFSLLYIQFIKSSCKWRKKKNYKYEMC